MELIFKNLSNEFIKKISLPIFYEKNSFLELKDQKKKFTATLNTHGETISCFELAKLKKLLKN